MTTSSNGSRLLQRFTWATNIYNATESIYYLLTYDFFYACKKVLSVVTKTEYFFLSSQLQET